MLCLKRENASTGKVPVTKLEEPKLETTEEMYNDTNAGLGTQNLLSALRMLPRTRKDSIRRDRQANLHRAVIHDSTIMIWFL